MPATERTPLKGDAAPRRHWSSICCYSSRESALWCTLTLIGITSLLGSGVNTALYPAQQTEFTQRGFKAVTLWPGIGTAFYALGKLSQIIVIDRLGVYSTCCICLFMSTLGTFITKVRSANLVERWRGAQQFRKRPHVGRGHPSAR